VATQQHPVRLLISSLPYVAATTPPACSSQRSAPGPGPSAAAACS
jgi:hypothetical protein